MIFTRTERKNFNAFIVLGFAILALGAVYTSKTSQPFDPAGFVLQRTDGTNFEGSNLAQGPALVFFGYTYCPDICPLTLNRVLAARKMSGREEVPVYFISVDPERDSLDNLRQYEIAFGRRFIALRGDRNAIAKALDSFGARASPADENGLIIHPATLFLIEDDHDLRRIPPPTTDLAPLAETFSNL
jgi:protein SCO1